MPIESMKLSSDKRLYVLFFHNFYLRIFFLTFLLLPCRISRLSTTSHDSLVKIWDASLEVMDNELFSEEDEEEEEDLKERVNIDVGGKRSRESDEDEGEDENAEQEAGEEDDDDSDDSESDSDDEKRKPKAKKSKKSFAVDRNREFFADLD